MIGPALLHSVSYAGLWGQAFLPVDEFLDKAAALGYQGVMLMAKHPHLSVLDHRPKERARLRRRLEKNDSLQTDLYRRVYQFHRGPRARRHPAPRNPGSTRHRAGSPCPCRLEFGRSVRVFTGYEAASQSHSAQWRLVVGALKECARRAAEFDVTIGVQNHHDIACSSEALFELIRAVGEPNCKAMFDAWAPALHGDDLNQSARKMGTITCHTTIANYVRLRRFHYDPAIVNYDAKVPSLLAVPIDEGFINYRAFLQALCAGGFTGSVAYEICSTIRDGGSLETLDRYARAFLEFLDRARHEIEMESGTEKRLRFTRFS